MLSYSNARGSKNLPNYIRSVSSSLDCLKSHVEIFEIFDNQYEFPSRSTADLVSFVTQSWNKSLEFRCESEIVALDKSAFDLDWHQALFNKLPAFGLLPKLSTRVSLTTDVTPLWYYQRRGLPRVGAISNFISPAYLRPFSINL